MFNNDLFKHNIQIFLESTEEEDTSTSEKKVTDETNEDQVLKKKLEEAKQKVKNVDDEIDSIKEEIHELQSAGTHEFSSSKDRDAKGNQAENLKLRVNKLLTIKAFHMKTVTELKDKLFS